LSVDKLLSKYFSDGKWEVEAGQSGWNNTTRFVRAAGKRWVLRIYQTHRDADKVLFEHEVLRALNQMDLPFQVPCPAACDDGNTISRLAESGGDAEAQEKLACLFAYIEGTRPPENDAAAAYRIGIAAGQLSRALSGLQLAGAPAYPPYYEMDAAYPLCTPGTVAAFCFSPAGPFEADAVALKTIGEAIERFRAYLPQFRELPHQLVHGDINHSNMLTGAGDDIAAILDFEFCTRDARAMEPAVIVSGLLSGSDPLSDSISDPLCCVESFLRGFGESCPLHGAEAAAIPLLVELRILDVFMHFLSRYLDGVDGEDVLKAQIRSADQGLLRLRGCSEQLSDLLFRHLTT